MDAYLQDNCTELEMTRWTKRPAMLVVPGGAYQFISEREGEPIALRYAAAGFQTFVLHYSVNACFEETLLDIAEAVQQMRLSADAWRIHPQQITVLGSSAGGNLALWLAARTRQAGIGISGIEGDLKLLRPNALVLCYPAVTGAGCAPAFMQTMPDQSILEQAEGMPPAFLWATQEDKTVPVEGLLQLVARMNQAGVPIELHLYQRGDHGLATADRATGRISAHVAGWVSLSIEWLFEQFGL